MSNAQVYSPTMDDLLQRVGQKNRVEINQKISGTIIFIAKNQCLIEIENIGLGIVRGKELYNEDFLSKLKIGETVDAIVLEIDNELGFLELSFREIGKDAVWEEINKAYQEKLIVDAKIKDANRGGFLVKIKGIDGFLPASLLSPIHAIKNANTEENSLINQMKKYLNQTFQVKIININQETETLIVSEKLVSDEIAKVKMQKFKVGDIIEGNIVGVVDFGLFVRFDDDLEGLIHISEIAWKKIDNTSNDFKIGQSVKAKIIDINSDNRVNLSIKQLLDSPWKDFVAKNKVGDTFRGKITKIVNYGAIVLSDEEIQGLCHLSQITTPSLDNPSKIHEYLKVGEYYDFTILSIDEEEKLYLTMLGLEKGLEVQKEINDKKNTKKKKDENIEED